jgi:predicted O-methyltransferase YrrM
MSPELLALADATKGWLHPSEGMALYDAAASCSGPFLEVGTYCGKSTVFLGAAAKANKTVLFTVDHHRGSPEMAADRECHDPEVLDAWGDHDTLLTLRRTLLLADLESTVIPVVGSTATVGPHWTTRVGFAFIDAAHDDDGVMLDATTWGRHVRRDGIIAFHDTTIPGIARAVEHLLATGFNDEGTVDTLRLLRRE